MGPKYGRKSTTYSGHPLVVIDRCDNPVTGHIEYCDIVIGLFDQEGYLIKRIVSLV
jgi:hypothetical protein